MFTSIKTSKANKEIVQELTYKLGLGSENVIARIAFAYSISKETVFDLKDIKDSQGKEYPAKILFGNNLPYYVGMVCVNYNIHKANKDVAKYIKMHVDDGLLLLSKDINKNKYSGIEFLLRMIEEGLVNIL